MSDYRVLEQRVKVCEKRLDKVEETHNSINKINVSLQKLTDTTDNLVEVVKTQNERLTAIEQKPIKRIEKVEGAMLAKVGAGLGAIILVLIVVIILYATKVI